MKEYFLKKTILTTLTLSLLSSAAQSGRNYADIFTRDIYDESTVLSRPFGSEEEKNKELIKTLQEKKENLLNINCIKKIKNKVNILKDHYSSDVQKSFWEESLLAIEKIVSPI